MNECRDFVNFNNELDKKKDRAEIEAAHKGQDAREKSFPTQASPEMFGKAAERIERERQRSGAPSSWGGYKKAANTPAEKTEIRKIIMENYKKFGPKEMDPEDLKSIGKHSSQISYPKIKVPSVNLNLINRVPLEPEIPIDQRIKVLADQRLKNEQRAWDYKYGRGGIAEMQRPK